MNNEVIAAHHGALGAGWWVVPGQTCVAAYQPKGAASLAASYVNLANPGTYDAAPGVAPTWAAATGWTFNGTTQYLTTGCVPAQGWSLALSFADCSSDTAVPFGSLGPSVSRFWVRPKVSGYRYYGHGNDVAVLGIVLSGVMIVAGNSGYLNGVPDGVISGGNYTFVAPYIGALNNAGTASFFSSIKVRAAALYSGTLSSANAAALAAAMAAL